MNSLKLHSKDLLTIDECLTIVCNDLRLANSDNLILRDYKLCKVNELFGFAGNYHSLQITIEFKVFYYVLLLLPPPPNFLK